MTRNARNSLPVRKYLVSVYIMQGYAAAKPLAIKYGYPPRYLNRMAEAMLGHSRTIHYSRSPFVKFEAYRFDPRFAPIRISNETGPDLSNHSTHQVPVSRAADPPLASAGIS